MKPQPTPQNGHAPYLPVLKALEIVGITPEVKAGKLIVDLDELLRAEYAHLTGIDINTYLNGEHAASGDKGASP